MPVLTEGDRGLEDTMNRLARVHELRARLPVKWGSPPECKKSHDFRESWRGEEFSANYFLAKFIARRAARPYGMSPRVGIIMI
jgi:hypothetical protein